MTFDASIVINESVLYYPSDKIELNSNVSYGIIDYDTFLSDNLIIEGNVTKADLTSTYLSYVFDVVNQYEWYTEDGYFFNTRNVTHIFTSSGTRLLRLTVWSDIKYYLGTPFRFKYYVTKNLEIKPSIYKFMIEKLPMINRFPNQETNDFVYAASLFFERMSNDIKGIYDLIDIRKVNPKYFEYMAATFGHNKYYSRKVSSKVQDDSFENYDIYERIKQELATPDEISMFRQFLLFSSELFNGSGTPENVKKFLSFFSVDAMVIDLYTQNWGITPKGILSDNFVGYTDFADNKFNLKWIDIRVTGNNNDSGALGRNFNDFVIDSYHVVQKIQFSDDSVGTNINGWPLFKIQYSFPQLLEIRNENGNYYGQDLDSDQFDINTNFDIDTSTEYPYLLAVNNDLISEGDRLSITYSPSKEIRNLSLVASTDKVQNFDVKLKFKFDGISSIDSATNILLPDHEISYIFRGTKTDDVNYSNFDEYYTVIVNGSRSSVSLAKIVKNAKNQPITQKINLGDNDTKIYDRLIVNSAGENYLFKIDTTYELFIVAAGSIITAYFREVASEDIIENKVKYNIGDIEWGIHPEEYIELFTGIDVVQDEKNVLSLDIDENPILSYPYTPLLHAGNYGIASKNSIIRITGMTLNNLDLDDRLYSTAEKEFNLKPKLLDWNSKSLLNFNSTNSTHDDKFSKIISNKIGEQRTFAISKETSHSLQDVLLSNGSVTEEIGTRYAVKFDQTWIDSTFSTTEDILSKIVIPIGSQPSWFMLESRLYSRDLYKNYYGTNTITQDITSGGIAKTVSIPGYSIFNLTPTIGSYKTQPSDNFSSLERTDIKDASEKLIKSVWAMNKRISQYKQSGKKFVIKGVYQEVCPYSTVFSEDSLYGPVEVNGSHFTNPVFFPIVVDQGDNKRIIGVRFKNCSDIENLIKYSSNDPDNVEEVQLYGLFYIQVPIESIQFRANQEYGIDANPEDDSYSLIKVFLPLGILNKEIQNYSLSTEYMHITESLESSAITIDGIYARTPKSKYIYKESDNTLELLASDINSYENDADNLKARSYLSAELDLSTNFTSYEQPEVDILPTKFIMNYDIRKLLSAIKESSSSEYADDYLWWIPKELWLSRDFQVLPLDEELDIASGLNFSKNSAYNKSFYGLELTAGQSFSSYRIHLLDGKVNPYTTYYAKVKIRMNVSGYDELYLGNASMATGESKPGRPLNAAEAKSVVTLRQGQEIKYRNHIQAPVGECFVFLIPIAWYDPADVSSKNILEWGNYLKGSAGTGLTPSVSLTPYGLMTWLLNKASAADTAAQDILKITAGWSIVDWNREFKDLVKVEGIYEQIPSDKYSLYQEYGLMKEYSTKSGSYIEINYNAGEMPWVVNETAKLGTAGISKQFFDIPPAVYRLEDWFNEVGDIKVHDYSIPKNLYIVKDNSIQLKDDLLFKVASDAKLLTVNAYDTYFNSNIQIVKEDDFSKQRNINWISYEENNDDFFVLSRRLPSLNLSLSGADAAFSSSIYNNIDVFRRTENRSTLAYNPKKSGSASKINGSFKKSDNGGYIKNILLSDIKSNVYSITTEVLFTKELDALKDYNGKRFELILKTDIGLNPFTNKYILSKYYFVGINTYDFEISLGVAIFNPETNKMDKSFLAGFGDYKSRNIKTENWYKLKAIVDEKFIRIVFNDINDADRIVLNYNIDIKYIEDSSRYLHGDFEELVYLLTGLENLKITYPDNLASITDSSFVNNNWNEELAKINIPSGSYIGIGLFNEFTILKNAKIVAEIPNDKTFGTTIEATDYNAILGEITQNYHPLATPSTIGKTTNGSVIVLWDNVLFYKIHNQPIVRFHQNVSKIFIIKDKILILFNNSFILGLVSQEFSVEKGVYIKDSFFNADHLYKYLQYTERSIEDIYTNSDKIYITFKDT